MRRRNKTIIVALCLVAGVFYLDILVPIYKKCQKGSMCRLCGVHKSETTVHLWAFRVHRAITSPTRTAHTDLYDKYIAEPHQHQWCGGGFGTTSRHIWGGGLHLDGLHGGEYPIYQYRLSRDLLAAMELFKDEPIEFRREIFHDLIECKDRQSFERVRQLLKDMQAAPDNARNLYETFRGQQRR